MQNTTLGNKQSNHKGPRATYLAELWWNGTKADGTSSSGELECAVEADGAEEAVRAVKDLVVRYRTSWLEEVRLDEVFLSNLLELASVPSGGIVTRAACDESHEGVSFQLLKWLPFPHSETCSAFGFEADNGEEEPLPLIKFNEGQPAPTTV